MPLDGAHVRLEHVNLVTRRGERRVQEHRHGGRFGQQCADGRHDVVCADGNEDAEFPQQATNRVESCRSGREPSGPQAMQRRDGLVRDTLDGDGVNLLIPIGFEKPFRVGAVGLVASHVRPHVVRGEEPHRMPEWLKLSRPVVRGPACLQEDRGRRPLGEEVQEAIA